MAYVGAIYNPPPVEWLRVAGRPLPRVQARYVSGLYPLAEMGPLLRRQAGQVGMEGAEVWVALTDGGNGLESFVQSNFNRADLVVILDFYHPTGYLKGLAKAALPHDEAGAEAWTQQWCRLLKEEGGAATLAVLREWSWPTRKSSGWRAQWAKVEEYFGNNLHRMEYPEYLAQGWHIGSGVVESACKTVVGQRLKGAGKRWGEDGRMRCATYGRFIGVRKGNGKRIGTAEPRTARLFSNKSDAFTQGNSARCPAAAAGTFLCTRASRGAIMATITRRSRMTGEWSEWVKVAAWLDSGWNFSPEAPYKKGVYRCIPSRIDLGRSPEACWRSDLHWKVGNVVFHNDVVIYRVLAVKQYPARRFLMDLKEELKRGLRQQEILFIKHRQARGVMKAEVLSSGRESCAARNVTPACPRGPCCA